MKNSKVKVETDGDAKLLNGLAELYNDACTARDYRLCDRIRGAIDALLKGKPPASGVIKIDNDLGFINSPWSWED